MWLYKGNNLRGVWSWCLSGEVFCAAVRLCRIYMMWDTRWDVGIRFRQEDISWLEMRCGQIAWDLIGHRGGNVWIQSLCIGWRFATRVRFVY